MLARIRVSIPDQPGTLGRVAAAIGIAGADVHEIQVLGSDLGRATDDVWVRVAGSTQLDRLVRALASIPGVSVDGVRSNVCEVSRLGELELISAILANHDLQVLVDQAVVGLDATWAAVVDRPVLGLSRTHAPEVLVASAQGPAIGAGVDLPIRLAARETEQDGSIVVVPLPPTQGALVMARLEGPSYHATEVFRLGELGRVLGKILERIATGSDPATSPVCPDQSRSTM